MELNLANVEAIVKRGISRPVRAAILEAPRAVRVRFRQLVAQIGLQVKSCFHIVPNVHVPTLVQRVLVLASGNMLPPFTTVAVIVVRNSDLLVIRRREGIGYSLAGGFLKWNENAVEAAIRETKEETGYLVEILDLAGVYSRPHGNSKVHNVTLVYTARVIGGELGGSPEGTAEWIHPEQLKGRMAFNHDEILANFLKAKVPIS